MFLTLILVLIVIAAFSLLYWGLTQMTLPQPVKIVLIVVLGLIGLAIIYNSVASGGFHLGTLH